GNDMNLSQAEKDRLLNFIGYGSLQAPIWFLGMEEGTGGSRDPEAIETNIRTRARHFQPVDDLVETHQHWDYDIPSQRKFTQVWLWMAKLTRGTQGAADWPDTENAKHYVRESLGRQDGDTLLTELLPLPSPSMNFWPYETLYPTRADYLNAVLPARQRTLRMLIQKYQPRCVIAYGSQYHRYYKALFASAEWHRLPTKKAIEHCRFGHSLVVLMPFFGNGGLSTHDARTVIDVSRAHCPG
ncbi:MAG: hypothetical protein K8J31_17490, partial [Anaerolineae bacterium]|nr:hypothetical protein [Anaerolineae bacterium]